MGAFITIHASADPVQDYDGPDSVLCGYGYGFWHSEYLYEILGMGMFIVGVYLGVEGECERGCDVAGGGS